MVVADPSTRFSDLHPMKSDPPLYHIWGFGLYLCGERDFDPETASFVRTLCFCLLYFPIYALRVPGDAGRRRLDLLREGARLDWGPGLERDRHACVALEQRISGDSSLLEFPGSGRLPQSR